MENPFHRDRPRHSSATEWRADPAAGPVRVRSDPARSTRLGTPEHRVLRPGLSGTAVAAYVDEWIVELTGVTALAHEVRDLVRAGRPGRGQGQSSVLVQATRPVPRPVRV